MVSFVITFLITFDDSSSMHFETEFQSSDSLTEIREDLVGKTFVRDVDAFGLNMGTATYEIVNVMVKE
jgi:hypothetical protein